MFLSDAHIKSAILNVGGPCKVWCVKGLFPWVLLWRCWNPQKWGLLPGPQVGGRVTSGSCGTSGSSCLSSAPGSWGEQFAPALLNNVLCWFPWRPKAGPLDLDWNLQYQEPKQTFYFFKSVASDISLWQQDTDPYCISYQPYLWLILPFRLGNEQPTTLKAK